MKQILILIILAAFAYGIYYGYTEYCDRKISLAGKLENNRDLAFSKLKIDVTMDSNGIGLYIASEWYCQLNNPSNSSVYMECIVTKTESGIGKKVIATSNTMSGLSDPVSGIGGLPLRISKKDISPDYPYLWVKINSVINKVKQKPIVKFLGKYN